MTYQMRQRVLKEYKLSGTYHHWLTGDHPYSDQTNEMQMTWSEGHAVSTLGRTGKDVGGPFDTIRNKYHTNLPWWETYVFGSAGDLNTGNLFPNLDSLRWVRPGITWDQFSAMTSNTPLSTLNAYGAKAISDTIPTNPMVDGAVGIAELMREGLPSIVGGALLKSRMSSLRSVGSEYLNWEFGWKPLISDLMSASKAILETEAHLKQLQRDSGKSVRRRRSFNKVVTTWDLDYRNRWNLPWPGGNTNQWTQSGLTSCFTPHQETEMSFSGAYTFHYDPGDLSEISRIATQARLLYGLKVDPDVIWNLAPWSWLVDWVANVGPVLKNLSAFSQDGLVLRYGYLMEHSTTKWGVWHWNVNTGAPLQYTGPPNISGTHSLERKRRIRATPYGFGLFQSSFTARQWTILSALGMTRGPKSL